jgi:myo-inositol-1(or 4)-monophosphatase
VIGPTVATLSPDRLELIALQACRTAADVIRNSLERATVATKSTSTDIVTATDLAAERSIRDVLAQESPGSMVLGEEGGYEPAGRGPHGAIEWVVDPLDGTVNFAYGIPITAVSVAAVVSGRPMAGAVVDVGSGDSFSAHLGGGSRWNDAVAHVSTCDQLPLALVATGYSYDPIRREQHGRTVADLVGRVRDLRAFGSAALHLCWVAVGRLDGYVERDIKPWDHAAGGIIAREAGALVELPCPENDHLALVANPLLHGQMRSLVTEGRASH